MYACNGILFNHESPRRGETFVTRKITRALANISQGVENCLYLGNMDALRDWGHAKDYVEMQWLMMQQDKPEDYVIATGKQVSVRDFVVMAAKNVGVELAFRGSGTDEIAIVASVREPCTDAVKVGDTILKVDPRYFRPAEVETLLGWTPAITVEAMCAQMVTEDIKVARRSALLETHGLSVPTPHNE